MTQTRLKRLLILNIPYVLIGLYATKLAEAWRLAEGTEISEKLLHLMDGFLAAFRFHGPASSHRICCWAWLWAACCGWQSMKKAETPRSTGAMLSMAPRVGASRAISSRSLTLIPGTT